MSKDLQYYLDHPEEELPNDPEVLAQLAANVGTEAAAETEEKDVKKEEPAPSSDEVKKEEAKAEEAEEQKGIATRDGKGIIPFDVLKTERDKRQAAETTVAELTSKVEEIQQQLAKGTNKGDAKAEELGAEALATMSPEELNALRADFPVFGKVIDTLMGTVASLTNEVNSLKKSEQSRDADTRRNVAVSVQELIDNEPVLTYLQTQDPALFDKAIAIDNTLKGDKRYPTMESRFAKVAELMDATFGPFEGVAKKAAPAASKDEPVVSKEQARETVLKKVAETKVTPKSLSDIPSGEMPESDEMANLENLSAIEVSDRLMKMSADQRTAFLKRF